MRTRTGIYDKYGSVLLVRSIAIITGGAGLFGETISRALAEFGADVVIVDTNVKKAEEIVSEIPNDTKCCDTDITSKTAVETLMNTVTGHSSYENPVA